MKVIIDIKRLEKYARIKQSGALYFLPMILKGDRHDNYIMCTYYKFL